MKRYDLKKLQVCRCIWLSPMIGYNGDVTVCCNDERYKLLLGNIRNNSIEEIWTNKKAEKLRYLHITNQLEKTKDKICYSCRSRFPQLSIPDEWIIDYLKTISREDLIDFYLNRIRDKYPLEFQYTKQEDKDKITQEYPLYPNLIKTKHFRYKSKTTGYLGAKDKLTFYLQIPKNTIYLNLRFHAAGIKAPVTFETFLDGKPLGEKTVRKIGAGSGEIIEYTIDDNIPKLIEKDIVKLELKIKSGNLALFEKSDKFQNIQLTLWKNKPMEHKTRAGADEYSIFSPLIQGEYFKYSNEDNFSKGYSFLALKETSSITYFINIKKKDAILNLNLAGIGSKSECEISIQNNKHIIQAPEIGSGIGKIFTIPINDLEKGTAKLKITAKTGTFAILQDPLEKTLERTPLKIIFQK